MKIKLDESRLKYGCDLVLSLRGEIGERVTLSEATDWLTSLRRK